MREFHQLLSRQLDLHLEVHRGRCRAIGTELEQDAGQHRVQPFGIDPRQVLVIEQPNFGPLHFLSTNVELCQYLAAE